MRMVKSAMLFTALLIAGLVGPVTAGAKEDGVRKDALQPIKEARKGDSETKIDDNGGGTADRSAEPGDDRGNKLGLDDDVRDCYVYAASGQIPKPYLRYRSAADKARMEAEATLLSLVPTLYSDEITQFHDLNDDSATTFSMKAEQFHLRHRLGARGCAS
jgi:hypothetical protein